MHKDTKYPCFRNLSNQPSGMFICEWSHSYCLHFFWSWNTSRAEMWAELGSLTHVGGEVRCRHSGNVSHSDYAWGYDAGSECNIIRYRYVRRPSWSLLKTCFQVSWCELGRKSDWCRLLGSLLVSLKKKINRQEWIWNMKLCRTPQIYSLLERPCHHPLLWKFFYGYCILIIQRWFTIFVCLRQSPPSTLPFLLFPLPSASPFSSPLSLCCCFVCPQSQAYTTDTTGGEFRVRHT